jgi:hypothetical protein
VQMDTLVASIFDMWTFNNVGSLPYDSWLNTNMMGPRDILHADELDGFHKVQLFSRTTPVII